MKKFISLFLLIGLIGALSGCVNPFPNQLDNDTKALAFVRPIVANSTTISDKEKRTLLLMVDDCIMASNEALKTGKDSDKKLLTDKEKVMPVLNINNISTEFIIFAIEQKIKQKEDAVDNAKKIQEDLNKITVELAKLK